MVTVKTIELSLVSYMKKRKLMTYRKFKCDHISACDYVLALLTLTWIAWWTSLQNPTPSKLSYKLLSLIWYFHLPKYNAWTEDIGTYYDKEQRLRIKKKTITGIIKFAYMYFTKYGRETPTTTYFLCVATYMPIDSLYST